MSEVRGLFFDLWQDIQSQAKVFCEGFANDEAGSSQRAVHHKLDMFLSRRHMGVMQVTIRLQGGQC